MPRSYDPFRRHSCTSTAGEVQESCGWFMPAPERTLGTRSRNGFIQESLAGRGEVMNIAAGHTLEGDASVQGSPHRTPIQRADELSDEQFMSNLDGPEVEVALSKLYDRYSRTVFGVGLKILGDRSTAEELVQDVFLKVWRSSR